MRSGLTEALLSARACDLMPTIDRSNRRKRRCLTCGDWIAKPYTSCGFDKHRPASRSALAEEDGRADR